MSDTPQTINGELLRLKRESHGWLVSDLATRACMSVKQIRQLEEGGSSSFYSESVKITSAKKVGAILGLTQDEVFGVVTQAPDVAAPDAEAAFTEMLSQSPIHEAVSHSHAPTHDVSPVASAHTEQVPTESPTAATAPTPSAVADAPVQNDEPAAAEQKNKTPLGAIAALFVAALAVAAWMRPDTEPVAVEPPPPLQTLPVETPDGAASAASSDAPAVPASAASASTSQAAASSAAVAGASAAVSPAPPATAASASASKPL
jgi:transcriptional regulator with XRE-family HTH domain